MLFVAFMAFAYSHESNLFVGKSGVERLNDYMTNKAH